MLLEKGVAAVFVAQAMRDEIVETVRRLAGRDEAATR
jgi:hypothetical protein